MSFAFEETRICFERDAMDGFRHCQPGEHTHRDDILAALDAGQEAK